MVLLNGDRILLEHPEQLEHRQQKGHIALAGYVANYR
jgi:hypothetical protein